MNKIILIILVLVLLDSLSTAYGLLFTNKFEELNPIVRYFYSSYGYFAPFIAFMYEFFALYSIYLFLKRLEEKRKLPFTKMMYGFLFWLCIVVINNFAIIWT
jgi:hypothetical protein